MKKTQTRLKRLLHEVADAYIQNKQNAFVSQIQEEQRVFYSEKHEEFRIMFGGLTCIAAAFGTGFSWMILLDIFGGDTTSFFAALLCSFIFLGTFLTMVVYLRDDRMEMLHRVGVDVKKIYRETEILIPMAEYVPDALQTRMENIRTSLIGPNAPLTMMQQENASDIKRLNDLMSELSLCVHQYTLTQKLVPAYLDTAAEMGRETLHDLQSTRNGLEQVHANIKAKLDAAEAEIKNIQPTLKEIDLVREISQLRGKSKKSKEVFEAMRRTLIPNLFITLEQIEDDGRKQIRARSLQIANHIEGKTLNATLNSIDHVLTQAAETETTFRLADKDET